MDEPANLMQINGVLVLDGVVTLERIRAIATRRLLGIPRFRQRVVGLGTSHPRWEEDPALDVSRHVIEIRLPDPGDDAALSAEVSALMSAPLDPARPLWEFRLVQNYRGGSALFGRIHHAIGDGVGLMVVLLSLTDLAPAGPATVEPQSDGAEDDPIEAMAPNPFCDLFTAQVKDLDGIRQRAEEVMPDTMRLLLFPGEAFRRARFWTALNSIPAMGRLIARTADPKTAFKGPLGVPKLVAWSRRLDLGEIKDAGRALGGSINDVLLAATAGGLGRYLSRRQVPRRKLNVRAAMPVNLRPFDKLAELGNHFGLVFLSLPLGITDPLARLAEIRRRSQSLRHSAEPVVVYSILQALGRIPMVLQRMVVKIFATKTTAVMTNVPGPRRKIFLGGRPVRDIFFWVPQSGRVGLGVSIFSYDGGVRIGIGTDAGLIPDPEVIVDGFEAELAELLRLGRRERPSDSPAEARSA
jgi:diacylglycerol O-acyltransferase